MATVDGPTWAVSDVTTGRVRRTESRNRDETAPDEPSHDDIDREEDVEPDEERRRIDLVLKSLPLIERDLYLGMQAMNLTVVDSMIEEMEENLLAEYIQLERTPVPSVMAVAALSQLWIFGVYELLRTWRQRLQDVLSFADELSAQPIEERVQRIAAKEEKLNDRTHDDLRHLADDRPVFVLSAALQERVKRFEPYSYGIKRVILQLEDGSTFEASIAWNRYIVFVRGYDLPPFDPTHVVELTEVKPRQEPEEESEQEP